MNKNRGRSELLHDAQDLEQGKFPKVREGVERESRAPANSSISVGFRGRGWES